MLWPYLKIWDCDWIFGHAVKAISSLGVRSPCAQVTWLEFQLKGNSWILLVWKRQASESSKQFKFQSSSGYYKYLYCRVQNKRIPSFINFWNFIQGLQSYCGLKSLKFYYISLHILSGYVYSFCQIFQRLRLFKELRLFRTLEYKNLFPLVREDLVKHSLGESQNCFLFFWGHINR